MDAKQEPATRGILEVPLWLVALVFFFSLGIGLGATVLIAKLVV